MKRLLKGVKKYMHEKYEAFKESVQNPTMRFIMGSAILAVGVGLGGSMIATCFMPQFN